MEKPIDRFENVSPEVKKEVLAREAADLRAHAYAHEKTREFKLQLPRLTKETLPELYEDKASGVYTAAYDEVFERFLKEEKEKLEVEGQS